MSWKAKQNRKTKKTKNPLVRLWIALSCFQHHLDIDYLSDTWQLSRGFYIQVQVKCQWGPTWTWVHFFSFIFSFLFIRFPLSQNLKMTTVILLSLSWNCNWIQCGVSACKIPMALWRCLILYLKLSSFCEAELWEDTKFGIELINKASTFYFWKVGIMFYSKNLVGN